MTDEKKEELKIPEKRDAMQEAASAPQERGFGEPKEKKEMSADEKNVSEELKREIELMTMDENLKKEAEQKANKISFLADDDKLEELLKVAKEKGVVFAIKTAKSMNDPFLLDTLHDLLAKEGYYQKFMSQK